MAWMETDILKTYALSMDDEMAAGAFECARNYGGEGSFLRFSESSLQKNSGQTNQTFLVARLNLVEVKEIFAAQKKNSEASTGFEPMTSTIPVECSEFSWALFVIAKISFTCILYLQFTHNFYDLYHINFM